MPACAAASEIRALRWSSIDFGRGLLTVERAYSLDQVLAPKSDKSRTVPMTTRLREALQKHHATHEHTNVLVTRNWLNAAQRKAGLAEKGPHTLRHTFCSQLAMTGARHGDQDPRGSLQARDDAALHAPEPAGPPWGG